MFFRSLAMVFAVATVWWSSSSFGLGLGLGELRVDSTLASPLRATIPVTGLDEISLDAGEFLVTIESDSGTDIQHRLEPGKDGQASLILFTREPVTEPLFRFRVEIQWDRSSSARSYDVFIDPLAYSAQAGAAESASAEPVVAAIDREPGPGANLEAATDLPVIALSDPQASSDEPVAMKQASNPEEPRMSRREYGPTIDGNSIWRVARAVATDNGELNIYQWMHAIWLANPGAFYLGNMHRLNMGELLVIPFESEVAETSRRQAYRVYKQQGDLLSEPESGKLAESADRSAGAVAPVVQADSLEGTVDAEPPLTEQPQAEVTVVAGRVMPAAETDVSSVDAQPESKELSEAERLDAVIALIEEIEQSEASIVMPQDEGSADLETESAAVLPDSAEDSATGGEITIGDSSPLAVDVGDSGSMDSATVVLSDQTAATEDLPEPVTATTAVADGNQQTSESLLSSTAAPESLAGRWLAWLRENTVATSPLTYLAVGSLVTLALLALWRTIVSRRVVSANGLRLNRPSLRQRVPPVMAPVTTRAASANSPVKDESAVDAPAAKVRKQEPINEHADEILSKADRFLDAGDSGEAIKLLEVAMKVQPNQFRFPIRLLEIYHKRGQADEFERIMQRMNFVFEELDIGDQIHLQVMYAQVCPGAEPIIDIEQAVKAKAEAERRAALEPEPTEASDEPVLDDEAASEEGEFAATHVLLMNNGVPLENDEPDPAKDAIDLEQALKEADVYLAYGLYDNAEDLLLKGLALDPNRVDFLAKLLDSYFATKNLVDFVAYAEKLREMGEEVQREYWDKVEIMGYELAPYNELFSGGKHRQLNEDGGTDELQFDVAGAHPQEEASADEVEAAQPITEDPVQEEPVAKQTDSEDSADAVFTIDEDPSETNIRNEAADDELDDGFDDGDDEVPPASLSTAELFLDDIPRAAERESSEVNRLVDEVMASDSVGEETNLNLNIDETANMNFVEDNPVLIEQYEDDEDDRIDLSGELEDIDDLDLDQVAFDEAEVEENEDDSINPANATDELQFEQQSATGTIDQIILEQQDSGSEDMEFEIEQETNDSIPVASVRADKLATAEMKDARILHFPETGTGRQASVEFQSEVTMTLQAMRDQLQNLTERLYRQEREASELRQQVQQLSEEQGGKQEGKKSG